jgi:hypothetical protein
MNNIFCSFTHNLYFSWFFLFLFFAFNKVRNIPNIWVTGLLTGHCHLKGHIFKMRLTESLTCERCLEKDESATHILCDCEAIAYLRFRHLGHYFMEPGDYQDAPVSKILHFIQSVGLLEGWNSGGCTIDLGKVTVQGLIKAYPLFIQNSK